MNIAYSLWRSRCVAGLLLGGLFTCALAPPVEAQTFNWINTAGGIFGTSTNWSPLGPPSTTAHTARFGASGFPVVTLNATHTVGTLIVASATQFSAPGRTLNVGGPALINSSTAWSGGTLSVGIFSNTQVNAPLNIGTGSFYRTGGLQIGAASFANVSVNAAQLFAFGASLGQNGDFGILTFSNGSIGTLAAGMDIGAPGFANPGGVVVQTNSSVLSGTIQIGNQGSIVRNSELTISGGARVTMTPEAALIIGGSSIAVSGSSITRNGTLIITANSSTFNPGTPGTLTTGNGPTLVNYGGAISIGNGTFIANGDVQCNGLISITSQGSYLGGPAHTTRVDGTTLAPSGTFGVLTAPSFSGSGTITGGSLIIGSTPGSNGWAALNTVGSGSFAVAAVVGAEGAGRLDAAGLNTPSLVIGQSATGSGLFNAGLYEGSFTLSGAPTAGSVVVGDLGSGALVVRANSVMTATGQTDVARGAGSDGTISLHGDGAGAIATYAAAGQVMNVGVNGNGTLLVGPFSQLTLGTLTVGPDAGPGSGSVNQTGGSLSVGAPILVNPRGTYRLSGGAINAGVANNGTLIYSGGSFAEPIVNAGSLFVSAPLPIGAQIDNTVSGQVVSSGLIAGEAVINNAGSLGGNGGLGAGMTLNNAGTLTSAGGEFVVQSGATLTTAAGSMLRNAPASTLRIQAPFTNLGNIEVNAGGAVELAGALNIAAAQKLTLKGGLLAVGDGDTLSVASGASVVGFGQVNAALLNDGSVQFNGPTQLLGALDNNAAINVRNAATLVFGPATNDGSITVQNGTIIFEQAFARGGAGGGDLAGTGTTIVQPGGRLLAGGVKQATLALTGTAAAPAFAFFRPIAAGGRSSVVSDFSIAGTPGAYHSQFDLADNALIIDYTSVPPLFAVREYLVSGHAGGAWNGSGIASSSAAAATGRGVGFADSGELFASFPAVFAGERVDATSLLVRYTLNGDVNLDHAVDIGDFAVLAASFNQPALWFTGDFNYDGVTGIADFALLAANFNLSLPAPTARGTVPEPVCGLLAAGLLLGRRRRAPVRRGMLL